WHDRILRLLTEAQSLNEISADLDIEKTANSLVSLVDGIGVQVLLTGGKLSSKAQIALVDFWLDLIVSEAKR
ncbi:MAG: TetR family transcriptional regulator C-terminal domain-containing protein, partial [Phycisphaerales bacterium]|nr:TetR family transcriptional regulator C-terminal domain-containing protein [Phycisphaerales bacterium]